MNFKIGDKVNCNDGSYSYEFVDGKLKATGNIVNTGNGGNKYVYEVTGVNLALPTKQSCIQPGNEGVNDTIIRRVCDGKVFFTQSRFLSETVPFKPKFNRGDFVIYRGKYFRVSKVLQDSQNANYFITADHDTYRLGTLYVLPASEGELQHA